MIYIIIFCILLLSELLYFGIARRCGIVDKPNSRSSHTRVTLRGGGVVFLAGVWVWALFGGFEYPWFLAGVTLAGVVSFVDDVHSTPNWLRLIAQFGAMLLMFAGWGLYNGTDWWALLPALVVCVGIVNAYNFMDGINGITGCYSLAVLLPILWLDREYRFMETSFIIVVIISIFVFLIFNFRRKAVCFAGDVGSVSMAFIVLFALGRLILFTGNPVYLLFLAVYGIDSVLTIVHRLILHENLGQAHRKHAYQLMSNELSIPHVAVSLFYMAIQLAISAGLILLHRWQWWYFGAVIILLALAYIFFMRRYYPLHAAYLKKVSASKI